MEMSFVADILAAVVSGVLVYLCTHLVYPQLVYVIQYGSNLQDLRYRVTTLRAAKDRIDSLVNEAEDGGENVDPVVVGWLSRANGILQDADNWDTERVNLSQKWWHALRLDWCSRHRLSKYAKTMADDIDVVNNEVYSVIDAIPRPAHILCVEDIPTPDFIPLASSTAAIQRIMDTVKEEMITHIGVWGSEGVGKTTLIMQVAKQAAAAKLFDTVAIATVSRIPDHKVIQNSIAEFFCSRIEVESEHLRQSRLSNILKQKKKILIILDDVWDSLVLGELGIPYGNDHEGCKIIVTSRSLQVCNNMETNTNVLVEELWEQDRLVLFKKKAAIPDSHVLDQEVEELIKQLGGIPKSIIKAGRASRNKPPDQWIAAMCGEKIIGIGGTLDEEIHRMGEETAIGEAWRYAQCEGEELQMTALGRMAKEIMHQLMDKIRSIIGVYGHWRAGRRAKGIMHHLMDERNNIIGVCGHWRVNRTTLIKRLAEHAENRKLFNKVVKIEVRRTPVKIIQDQIAVLLGSEIEEEGEYLRRARLSEILKKEHKVLIILDEVRERLDLGYIGIPYGNEHKGCKIIVSSPDVELCNSMETDVSIGENKLWNQSEAIGCTIA